MAIRSLFRSIHGRLAALILLAMTALVVLLVYQAIEERSKDRDRAEEQLSRLATFAAQAQRERHDTAERLLVLASQIGGTLRTFSADPSNQELYDRCTQGLFVYGQLLPGTSGFTFWDAQGRSLCSSEAAKVGEFSAAETAWFRTAQERRGFATGEYELSPPDNEPSVGFGIPIMDAYGVNIIGYMSTGLAVDESGDALLAGENLPETGRVAVVDRNGVIINATDGRSGERIGVFPERVGSLSSYLDTRILASDGRIRAVVRVTDSDDAPVYVSVAADEDVLVTPLGEALIEGLAPVAAITLLSLLVVWLLGQRWIVKPVSSLVRASDALAAGQLSARARVDTGIAEFERLGKAFNDMAATRERASHAKDEFLGLVSHELKTPITTVLGNAEVLRNRGDLVSPELRNEALEDIHDSSLRLAAIIENLLALARLERGVGLEAEPLALLRITQSVSEEEMRRAPGRRVRVHGDSNVVALGGETYVQQVLQNLIANALKYAPANTDVEVFVEQDAGMALVRVCDRGRGVDASERNSVFEPFYRSSATSQFAEGMGIGLSVCKRLIEAMGGEIWCKAREGGGSEFGFSLPVDSEEVFQPGDDVVPSAKVAQIDLNGSSATAPPVPVES